MQPDPLLSDNEHQAAIMLAACCSSGSSTTLRPVLSPPLLLQQFQDATAIIEETENPPNVDSSMLDPQIFPETVLSSEEQLAEKISKLRAEDDCFQTTLGQLKLDQNQIRALSRSGVKDLHFTWKRLNQHHATLKKIPNSTTDYLLSMMHAYRPTIKLEDYIREIPKTARTLLKVPESERRKYQKRDVRGTRVGKTRNSIKKVRRAGTYMHFGVQQPLLVQSPGMVEKWQYINTWRLIYVLFPDFVPAELLPAIAPKRGEEYERDLLVPWDKLPKPDPEKTKDLVLHIHGHIDGVQWFKDTNEGSGVPILGRLVAVENKKSKQILKIPNLEPFVVGVMQV